MLLKDKKTREFEKAIKKMQKAIQESNKKYEDLLIEDREEDIKVILYANYYSYVKGDYKDVVLKLLNTYDNEAICSVATNCLLEGIVFLTIAMKESNIPMRNIQKDQLKTMTYKKLKNLLIMLLSDTEDEKIEKYKLEKHMAVRMNLARYMAASLLNAVCENEYRFNTENLSDKECTIKAIKQLSDENDEKLTDFCTVGRNILKKYNIDNLNPALDYWCLFVAILNTIGSITISSFHALYFSDYQDLFILMERAEAVLEKTSISNLMSGNAEEVQKELSEIEQEFKAL